MGGWVGWVWVWVGGGRVRVGFGFGGLALTWWVGGWAGTYLVAVELFLGVHAPDV